MSARGAQLRAYLIEGAGLPCIPGQICCALWTCGWIHLREGVDPAADIRGTFRTWRERDLMVTRGGGLMAMVVPRFNAAGLFRTHIPLSGDVGVIKTQIGPALAIRSGYGRWVWKGDGFNTVGEFETVAAWSIR